MKERSKAVRCIEKIDHGVTRVFDKFSLISTIALIVVMLMAVIDVVGGKLFHKPFAPAYELTQMVHGTEEADKAQAAARALFAQGGVSADMPTSEFAAADIGEGIAILDLMVKTKLAPSKGEARRLVQQGGVMVNDEKITAFDRTFTVADFQAGDFIIKKGKKTFHRVVVK